MFTEDKSKKDNFVDSEKENLENDKPPDDPTDDVSDNLLRWIEKKDK